MKIGYARVSTDDQKLDLQLDALDQAGCARIFQDTLSGAKADRPGLAQALDHLREGDTLIVWKLDRLGRKTTQLLLLLEDLSKRQIGFQSLQDTIDTTTPHGKLYLTLLAAFAEMERGLLIERTNAGIAAARARGRIGGRKFSLTKDQERRLWKEYHAPDWDIAEWVANYEVSKATIYRAIQRMAKTQATPTVAD